MTEGEGRGGGGGLGGGGGEFLPRPTVMTEDNRRTVCGGGEGLEFQGFSFVGVRRWCHTFEWSPVTTYPVGLQNEKKPRNSNSSTASPPVLLDSGGGKNSGPPPIPPPLLRRRTLPPSLFGVNSPSKPMCSSTIGQLNPTRLRFLHLVSNLCLFLDRI